MRRSIEAAYYEIKQSTWTTGRSANLFIALSAHLSTPSVPSRTCNRQHSQVSTNDRRITCILRISIIRTSIKTNVFYSKHALTLCCHVAPDPRLYRRTLRHPAQLAPLKPVQCQSESYEWSLWASAYQSPTLAALRGGRKSIRTLCGYMWVKSYILSWQPTTIQNVGRKINQRSRGSEAQH